MLLEPMATTVPKVLRVHKVNKESRESKVLLEPMATTVPKVLKVHKDNKASREFKVL